MLNSLILKKNFSLAFSSSGMKHCRLTDRSVRGTGEEDMKVGGGGEEEEECSHVENDYKHI